VQVPIWRDRQAWLTLLNLVVALVDFAKFGGCLEVITKKAEPVVMGRPPRADEAGGIYHVLNRGKMG